MTEKSSQIGKLKHLLASPDTEFICEAHNAISAKIVEEAGFSGIWASGLAISAQAGVRDANELTWTQIIDHLDLMTDACDIPILLDGDTGYGDFNTVRRLVRKLEQVGVAGVCFEDKLYPKTNSFINGDTQSLAKIGDFTAKIRAAKDTQSDERFTVVARIEAFIAGYGLEEALTRANAYQAAGADAILVHSRCAEPTDILAFMESWSGNCPVVIIPTTYYSTPTRIFEHAGISLVIWANHLIRASVMAMQSVAAEIAAAQSLVQSEHKIATLGEIFRLQGAKELLDAEDRYFATSTR